MTFTDREFRDAVGLFPTGVAVITAGLADGTKLGATVSSFSSISLSPPLILFSLARSAHAFGAWSTLDHYAVNVLEEDQDGLSTRFARPKGEKWAGIGHVVGASNVPLLPHAAVWFECESYNRYDGGDHLILVGRVLAIKVRDASQNRPLVFHRGRYRRLDVETNETAPPEVDYLLHGW